MNVNEIEAFVSIVQSGGVTRAADRLHRSQPAITRRIRQLEDGLGVPLLERIGNGIRLTEAGRAFLPYAEAVLAALKDGAAAVKASQAETRGTVSLAIVGTLAATSLVAQLKQFGRQHSNARIELRTANSQQVSELVRRAEVELGIRYFDDESRDLVSLRIAEENMVVACPPDHPLAGTGVDDSQRLKNDRWVAFPVTRNRRESLAHFLVRQLALAHLDGAEIVEIDSLTAQKRLVEAGFGLALLPESSIQEELQIGALNIIDVPMLKTAVPVFVIYRRNGYLSGATRALLASISDLRVAPAAGQPPGRAARSKPVNP